MVAGRHRVGRTNFLILIYFFLFAKETHRYICNDNAEVICLDGYKEPEDEDERDLKVQYIQSTQDLYLI